MTIYSARRCVDNLPCCCEDSRPIMLMPPIPNVPTSAFADYYALAPTDNATPIAAGSAVAFPRGSASDFRAITRMSDSSFNLVKPGAYLVMFNVNTEDADQLVLSLNSTELAYTLTGSETAGTQINGIAVVTVTQPNSTLSVINPSSSTSEVVITQNAGGTSPSSSHLVIVKLA